MALKLPLEPAPSERTLERLRHEYSMLLEAKAPGVVRVLELSPHNAGLALVMERWGDASLDRVLSDSGSLPVATVMRLGAMVARALGRVHRKGVVHRDIKPQNLLVDAERREVKIIDFGLAVRSSAYVEASAVPESLAGTLAYMAPEQTGRMNRGIDSRADLYALGATLYQMLTGVLPFEFPDTTELIHAHLARIPMAPHERAPSLGIPEVVSAIVQKLMAKNPDHRYQTAEGVAFDLEQVDRTLRESGAVPPFELGTHDWPERICKPSRLYGREAECEALEQVLKRVLKGSVELVLVAGPSGVGKSALVLALRERVRNYKGIFAPGKFEQIQRGTPYLALSQALRSIARRRLADSSEDLDLWKDAWRKAAGPNGRILVDMIPELVHILGEPPPLCEVGPIEAKNRFQATVQHFVRATATATHPLVLFVDDLQWADSASLQLLRQLIADPDAAYILFIGAYRDNEADEQHPLHALRQAILEGGRSVLDLALAPLGIEALSGMVADMLGQSPEAVQPLSRKLKGKTDGSPFFVEQFLRALHGQRLLVRDAESGAWHWNAEQVARADVTDNVVALLTRKMGTLSATAQRVLSVGACVGASFDLEIVRKVEALAEQALREAVAELVREGLLTQAGDLGHDIYAFVHDQVQRAAYEALGEEERRLDVHHALAQVFESMLGAAAGDDQLFSFLHHRLHALSRLVSSADRCHVAELCLRAGLSTKAGSAYAEAVRFLEQGRELLGTQGWEQYYALAFELHLALAETEWVAGRPEVGEQLFRICMERAQNRMERGRTAAAWVPLLGRVGRFSDAIEIGLSCLEGLGWSFPRDAAEYQPFVKAQIDRIMPWLMASSTAELAAWKRCTSLEAGIAGGLLARVTLTVATNKPQLLPALCFALVEHTLHFGVSRTTPIGGGLGAMMAILFLQDLGLARRFVQLGQIHLREAIGLSAYATHVLSLARQYLEPFEAICEGWEAGAEVGYREGDIPFAERCATTPYLTRLLSGRSLLGFPSLAKPAMDFAARGFRTVLSALHAALVAKSPASAHSVAQRITAEAPVVPVFLHWNHTCAAWLALHMNDDTMALDYALRAEPHASAAAAGPNLIAMVLVLCLCAERFPQIAAPAKARIAVHRARIEQWAACTPENFLHMKQLVDAWLARNEGRHADAERLFEEAVKDARANGFHNDEALALRMAGDYFCERMRNSAGRGYLTDACDAYLRWGAPACAQAIRDKYPQFFQPLATAEALAAAEPSETARRKRSATSSDRTAEGQLNLQIDIAAVLQAMQALSGELVLESLVGRVLRLLAENAGADRAVLSLVREGRLRVEAQLTIQPEHMETALNELVEHSFRLPRTLVQYVARGKESVVLGHAVADNRFDDDPYLRGHRPASVLAVPLMHQGRLLGVMYLEHARAADAFPKQRLELVSLLASQAATAVENATLYAEVQRKTEALIASNERLELQVEDRTAQLRAAKEAADAANQAKSDFLSSMSHELRTPLNGILGYAQVLERASELSTKNRDAIRVIKRSGDHLLTLINDVLDLAKIEAGKMELVPRDIHFPDFIRTVANLCRVRAEQKGISLTYSVANSAPKEIRADEKRLMQVLLNLLGNATKFTQQGSVSLRVEMLDAPDGGERLTCFEIRDTGPGIAPEHLGRIFEPFEQVGDKKARAEGTGLGLAICKRLIEQMGGRIEVESELGKGSIFRVFLTLTETTPAASAIVPASWTQITGYQGARRTLLVVDDNPDNRAVMRELLLPLNFLLLEAEGSEQALELARMHQPALIFMDLSMPQMDGFEATRRLRQMPELANVVILACSANVSDLEHHKSLRAGFSDFLPKPVHAGDLIEKLKKHLDLEWIREQPQSPVEPELSLEKPESALFVRPDSKEVALLRDLAARGRLILVLKEVKRLGQTDARLAPWLEKVRVLAEKCQLTDLRQLLQEKS